MLSITIHDDKKCKHQSFSAEINEDEFSKNQDIYIIGYGYTEVDALIDLLVKLNKHIDEVKELSENLALVIEKKEELTGKQ